MTNWEKKIYDKEIKKIVSSLEEGDVHYDGLIKWLKEEDKAGRISLTALGINEDKCVKFRKKGAKKSAQMWLESLRRGIFLPNEILSLFFQEVKSGGLSLAELGTSEKEIEELKSAKNKFEPVKR
jgi:hypothetical protein